MFFNLPIEVILVIVLVVLALACWARSLYWARRAKSYQADLEEEQGARDKLADENVILRRDNAAKARDLALNVNNVDDLQARIKGLEGSLAAREAECTRLQRLVTKAEQGATDARAERDAQITRANDENVTRLNTETKLFAARHGEDEETECFYRDHPGLLAPAPAEPAAEAAAEPAAEEAAPAEAETKPKANKKRSTKG